MSTVDFNYMKEGLTADLAGLLVAQNGMSIAEALDVLYNSDTFAKLFYSFLLTLQAGRIN